MRDGSPHIPVFSLKTNTGICGPDKTRILVHFTQCRLASVLPEKQLETFTRGWI